MKSRLRALAAALPLALAACGAPAAPPLAAGVAPAQASSAAISPALPETPDAPFRYVPPAFDAARFTTLAPVDVRLPNGLSGRLAEMRSGPVVAATVVVRWKTVAPVAGTAKLFGHVLGDAKLASGRTLQEELRDLGSFVADFTTQDATLLHVNALRPLLEQALGHVFAALRSGKLDAATFQRERDRWAKQLGAENPQARFHRLVGEQLFAASHPYRNPVDGTPEGLEKLKADDLARYRDAALAPDAVTVVAAGQISKADLTALLERVAGDWAAPKATSKPAAKAAAPAATTIPHGVFLVDDSDPATRASLQYPAPRFGTADYPAANVAWSVIADRAHALLDERLAGRWNRYQGRYLGRREVTTVEWFAEVKRGNAAGAVDLATQAIEAVARGELTDAEVARARQQRAMRAIGDDGTGGVSTVLSIEAAMLLRPGALLIEEGPAVQAVTRQDVIRAAQTYFKKDLATLVVTGDVAREKAAMEKLGLGPVTAPNDKKAQSKGAKK